MQKPLKSNVRPYILNHSLRVLGHIFGAFIFKVLLMLIRNIREDVTEQNRSGECDFISNGRLRN